MNFPSQQDEMIDSAKKYFDAARALCKPQDLGSQGICSGPLLEGSGRLVTRSHDLTVGHSVDWGRSTLSLNCELAEVRSRSPLSYGNVPSVASTFVNGHWDGDNTALSAISYRFKPHSLDREAVLDVRYLFDQSGNPIPPEVELTDEALAKMMQVFALQARMLSDPDRFAPPKRHFLGLGLQPEPMIFKR